jgi:hypothetical protein
MVCIKLQGAHFAINLAPNPAPTLHLTQSVCEPEWSKNGVRIFPNSVSIFSNGGSIFPNGGSICQCVAQILTFALLVQGFAPTVHLLFNWKPTDWTKLVQGCRVLCFVV